LKDEIEKKNELLEGEIKKGQNKTNNSTYINLSTP
jgi:hypothetical protein